MWCDPRHPTLLSLVQKSDVVIKESQESKKAASGRPGRGDKLFYRVTVKVRGVICG